MVFTWQVMWTLILRYLESSVHSQGNGLTFLRLLFVRSTFLKILYFLLVVIWWRGCFTRSKPQRTEATFLDSRADLNRNITELNRLDVLCTNVKQHTTKDSTIWFRIGHPCKVTHNVLFATGTILRCVHRVLFQESCWKNLFRNQKMLWDQTTKKRFPTSVIGSTSTLSSARKIFKVFKCL